MLPVPGPFLRWLPPPLQSRPAGSANVGEFYGCTGYDHEKRKGNENESSHNGRVAAAAHGRSWGSEALNAQGSGRLPAGKSGRNSVYSSSAGYPVPFGRDALKNR